MKKVPDHQYEAATNTINEQHKEQLALQRNRSYQSLIKILR